MEGCIRFPLERTEHIYIIRALINTKGGYICIKPI